MQNNQIPIIIKEADGVERRNVPVSIGVPFPCGWLKEDELLIIKDNKGIYHPVQVKQLARWKDKTIQWARLDFFVSIKPHSRQTWFIEKTDDKEIKSSPLFFKKNGDSYEVDTGTAKFYLATEGCFPFKQVVVNNKNILSSKGSNLLLIGDDGSEYLPVIESINTIDKGPIETSFFVKGFFKGEKKSPFARFESCLFFYRNFTTVIFEIRIHNYRAASHPGGLWDLGDPGSIFFKEMSLVLHGANKPESIIWQISPISKPNFTDSDCLSIYQDSSGGKNWNSPNHIDKNGNLTVSFQGYRLFTSKKQNEDLTGTRCNPIVQINMPDARVILSLQDFWQNFPKSINVEENIMKVGIFPKECSSSYELQGGEKKRHTLFLNFEASSNSIHNIPHFLKPLHISIEPSWIEKTKAIPYVLPEAEDSNTIYTDYIHNVIEGKNSFFNKREIIDEYGWRNFGDVYADHEAINAEEKSTFISHYNNQFDAIYGAGIHFLRSCDYRWFELMSQYARHVMDIDIYHTDQDKPAYNHGLFWHTDHYLPAGRATHRTYSLDNVKEKKDYGGGPCNEHNYTSGFLLYYYLTGDIFARDAVIELADWVVDMDDGLKTLWSLFDDGPTGIASQTVFQDFHGPGRGAGNSINALLDAYRLTGLRTYLVKAEEIIQRCIHPKDDINALHLDDPEYKWSYLVFLQILGKYLDFKKELEETDWHFFYARDTLLHYALWMMNNEVPYKDVLHKVEIPTETWPAHDVRKACILNYASKYAPADLKKPLKQKARFFFDRCLADLLSFETAYLTRPMVILMTYGFMQACFDNDCQETSLDYEIHNYDFGEPVSFVPQRARLKNTVKRKMKYSIKALSYLLNSKLSSIKARFSR